MTQAQWALLEPLLPPPGNTGGRGGRPEKHPRRRVLDAIFYVVRGGIAWAALPAEFPPVKTVYGIFRRWAAPACGSACTMRCATGPGCTQDGVRPRLRR